MRPDEQTPMAESTLNRCWRAGCAENTQITTANKQTACCPSLDATGCQPHCRQVSAARTRDMSWQRSSVARLLSLLMAEACGMRQRVHSQDVFVKTETKTYLKTKTLGLKTKTLFFVLEAPRDQECGLEDCITGSNSIRCSTKTPKDILTETSSYHSTRTLVLFITHSLVFVFKPFLLFYHFINRPICTAYQTPAVVQ